MPAPTLKGIPLRLTNMILAIVGSLMIAVGVAHLESSTDHLLIERITIGTTPATVFRKEGSKPAPVVVIAHGFAGSQQLMQPFAVTLARNGYLAVTYDVLGHGKNPTPLTGSILDENGATKALVDQLATVAAAAKALPGSDGRIAVLGHSMSSDIVVRYAQAHDDVAATVAVSMFAPGVTATRPRDLLVIVGALEPALLQDAARRATAMATKGEPAARKTYGDMAAGTARRFALSSGVEHIGVLYSPDSMAEARDWLDGVFDLRGSGYIDNRGRWLGLLFLGLVLLARPLSTFLPRLSERAAGANLPWSRLLPIAILPALLTPLVLWKAPSGFLPLLLGDYLAAHFLVYGMLTAVGLWLTWRPDDASASISWRRLGVAAGAVAIYGTLVFGWPIDRYVASFLPIPTRIPYILAMLVGTLPYFLADEWLTRGDRARWGAYVVTKFCFILSLAIAVALNLEKLFFLIIIAAVICLFFGIYGLFSTWAYRASRHPFVGGFANAFACAWALAVTFPLVGR